MYLKPGSQTALIFGSRSVTHSQLIARIQACAGRFRVASGDRVLILGPNSIEWVVAFYSAWEQGAIAVPVDFMSSAGDVAHILADCEPALVFCGGGQKSVLRQAMTRSGHEPPVVDMEQLQNLPDNQPARTVRSPDSDEVMELIYTSGTTGAPKGVMLTWDNILSNFEHVWAPEKDLYHPGDRFGAILPFHHAYPLRGSLTGVLYGGACVVIVEKLEPEIILRTMQENAVTHIPVVPRLLALFHQRIMGRIRSSAVKRSVFALARMIPSCSLRRRIFSQVHDAFGGNLDYMPCGGARLDPEIIRDFQVLGFTILDGFGMTETGPLISNNPKGGVRIGSVGQPVRNMAVRISDGEIQVKGRNVMHGYWNLPEETQTVIRDGWLSTGDLGELDQDGYLFITGRKKDILVLSNGKKINPEELEQALAASTPLIGEAGVFQDGDRIHAVIRPDLAAAREQGVSNIESAVREAIADGYNRSVPAYRKVTAITLVTEELPRTRLGNLRRFMLPELVSGNSREMKQTQREPDSDTYRRIRDYLMSEKNIAIHPDDDLEMDLGLDSMDRVSLQAWLEEQFDVAPADTDWAGIRTVRMLVDRLDKLAVVNEPQPAVSDDTYEQADMPRSTPLHRFMRMLSRVWLKLFFRVKVEGLDRLPDMPFILAPNHQSMVDGLLAAVWLPVDKFKRTYFFAKYKHFRSRWRMFMARRNNIILVDINRGLKNSLEKLGTVLKNGNNLIIFPEGTRTRDGHLQAFKKTFAQLSREFRIPVVPVVIKGAFEAFPPHRFFPRPRKITVSFLEPVLPDTDDVNRIMAEVERAIRMKLQGPTPANGSG